MFTIQFYPLGIRALLQMIMRHISNTNKYSLVMKDILSKVSTQDNWFSWAVEFYDLCLIPNIKICSNRNMDSHKRFKEYKQFNNIAITQHAALIPKYIKNASFVKFLIRKN